MKEFFFQNLTPTFLIICNAMMAGAIAGLVLMRAICANLHKKQQEDNEWIITQQGEQIAALTDQIAGLLDERQQLIRALTSVKMTPTKDVV